MPVDDVKRSTRTPRTGRRRSPENQGPAEYAAIDALIEATPDPDPGRGHAGRRRRREQVEALIAEGLSDMRIAVRIGCSRAEAASIRAGRQLPVPPETGGYDD